MNSDFEQTGYSNPETAGGQRSWFERKGFPEWLVALMWIFGGMVLFQMIGATFMIGSIIVTEGVGGITEQNMLSQPALMLTGNSIGQIFGLAIATMLIATLATIKGRYRSFMRFRMPSTPAVVFGLSFALIFVAQPLIWFLGWANQQIPMPDFALEMAQSSAQLTATILTSGLALWFLVLNIGVVPAVCEEIMFRSFLHRLFENAFGIGASLIITGVVFGLFHLNLPQVIPLAAIGILLGFLTVYSGSVYPAIMVHFLHNSGTVTAVHIQPELAEMSEAAEMPELWLVAVSLILTVYLIYLFKRVVNPTA